MPPPPPPRTGEKDEAGASDRKRPWTKPRIRTMRIVSIRAGTPSGPDEDTLTDPNWRQSYAPIIS